MSEGWESAPVKTDGAGRWVTAAELVAAEPDRKVRRAMARRFLRASTRGTSMVDAYLGTSR
jgi:hypothetical protein